MRLLSFVAALSALLLSTPAFAREQLPPGILTNIEDAYLAANRKSITRMKSPMTGAGAASMPLAKRNRNGAMSPFLASPVAELDQAGK